MDFLLLLQNINHVYPKLENLQPILSYCTKGGLIPEGVLTLVPLPKKSSKSLPLNENLYKFNKENRVIHQFWLPILIHNFFFYIFRLENGIED